MRMLEYESDLLEYGYCVFGADAHYEAIDFAKGCQEIKVAPTIKYGREQCSWGNVVKFVCREALIPDTVDDCSSADEVDEVARQTEFYEHYAEIMAGEYPGFPLVGFRLLPNLLILYYARPDGETYHVVQLPNAHLALTFTGPRTRLGFDPTYTVTMLEGRITRVEENSGYVRREIEFRRREPIDAEHPGTPYLHITEYADI